MTVHGASVNMRAMDTSHTEFLPRRGAMLDTVEQYVVSAARYLLEQQLGFVPAWAVLGDYLGSVGVRVIATLARAATSRGEP
ncbi:hypothetical protein NX786_11965 [Telluria mixta]|uniref:Uncharacterized protein n=1 Tax=Telluria mixta TaxID=34071 RepID=A0ABT2C057_9BURK|nr:hypothetical protein [Telluria mixta]MCS0630049.1 hypothetical protein [Telluria mixta]WEM94638.1 hypothetical protein P0M04_24540 [Telluria mixta]